MSDASCQLANMTPSLGSTNWVIELRKPIYSKDYWFIIKKIELRNSQMEEIHRTKYGEME